MTGPVDPAALEAERAAFEVWASLWWPNSHPPDAAWAGWQGRAAAALTPSAEAVEGLPPEPTEDMLRAIAAAARDFCSEMGPYPRARAIYRAILRAAPPKAVPTPPDAGWKLVPVEPVPEMVAAWYRYKNGHHFPGDEPAQDTSDYGAYRAMLAAAPAPPTPPASETGVVAKCSTEGCDGNATDYFESGGVGSHYCADCGCKIKLVQAQAEVERLKHDIARHVEIASVEASRAKAAEAALSSAVEALERLTSMEAFDVSRTVDKHRDAELIARMNFARDTLNALTRTGAQNG